jgi:maleylpyruvate isomerase
MSHDVGHGPDDERSEFEHLVEASRRLVHTVDGLTDEAFTQPSGLPGWSRGHVVAHLALNGESLARVVDGLAHADPVPMYDSDEARDADIEELATQDPPVLRERLLGSIGLFEEAVTGLPDARWAEVVERTPGGTPFPAHTIVGKRLREVEIHHVDLAAGYLPADWSPEFAATLVQSMLARTWPQPFRVMARDLARTWDFGPDVSGQAGPNITGDAAAIGWWLTGRGDGSDLTVDNGRLPEVEAW